MINCCFMNRKKYFRKILKTCSCLFDMRMKNRQKNNFFLRFRNYIRIFFYIVTKKRFDKHLFEKKRKKTHSRNYNFDCVHK